MWFAKYHIAPMNMLPDVNTIYIPWELGKISVYFIGNPLPSRLRILPHWLSLYDIQYRYIDGLVQDCSISTANTLVMLPSSLRHR